MSSLKDIEQAIQTLPAPELEELSEWFGRYCDSFDSRIESDLAAGKLTSLIDQAREQVRNGETRPL